MLTSKQRWFLFGFTIFIFVFSTILSPATSRLDNSINKREMYLFEQEEYLTYTYQNYSGNVITTLSITSLPINETHIKVLVHLDSDLEFYVSPQGFVYNGSTLLLDTYSPFWVYVPNKTTFAGVSVGDSYAIFDPIGFLPSNSIYTLDVVKKFTYYPIGEDQRILAGAQASFEAILTLNDNKIGEYIIDTTSGAVEKAEFMLHGDWIELTLTDTSFGISRHRMVLIVLNLVVSLVATVIVILLMKYRSQLSYIPNSKEDQTKFLLIFITGLISFTLMILDNWFYLALGGIWNTIIDVLYALLVAWIARKYQWGIKWVIPVLIEFLYETPFRDTMMIPYYGTTLAWMSLVWLSGMETKNIKLADQFI
ncbi:MAG: hypothetical protein INQ03_17605 [Candidatus Heimdallarchaeota archaeon]|nr:hypothetical protein [Candidatus Heimdallarchaeota archaeon]